MPDTRIPITRPYLGQEEVAAAAEVIRSGWLSQGPRVAAFEAAIAGYVGASHAIATSNCTTALHLALLGAGVGPGDEVICPSFTFIATANAIRQCGARPVFVDIDRATYNVDPELVEAAISPRTKAIVPVDQIGLAADLSAIGDIAHRHGLRVVEDAAPSLGAAVGGHRVGAISELTCFSFHPRKSITTGEGGMVIARDPDVADRLRRLRSHSASTSDLARHRSGGVDLEEYPEVGFNYRMTDIQAAIGCVQLGRLESILTERRGLANRYRELLEPIAEIATPCEPAGYRHTYQSYCVRLDRVPRAPIMAELAEAGIATRRGVMAIHLEPAYRDVTVYLPTTEAATEETLLLPLFMGMTATEQEMVAERLAAAIRRHRAPVPAR